MSFLSQLNSFHRNSVLFYRITYGKSASSCEWQGTKKSANVKETEQNFGRRWCSLRGESVTSCSAAPHSSWDGARCHILLNWMEDGQLSGQDLGKEHREVREGPGHLRALNIGQILKKRGALNPWNSVTSKQSRKYTADCLYLQK